jgi:hypothetical protein
MYLIAHYKAITFFHTLPKMRAELKICFNPNNPVNLNPTSRSPLSALSPSAHRLTQLIARLSENLSFCLPAHTKNLCTTFALDRKRENGLSYSVQRLPSVLPHHPHLHRHNRWALFEK